MLNCTSKERDEIGNILQPLLPKLADINACQLQCLIGDLPVDYAMYYICMYRHKNAMQRYEWLYSNFDEVVDFIEVDRNISQCPIFGDYVCFWFTATKIKFSVYKTGRPNLYCRLKCISEKTEN